MSKRSAFMIAAFVTIALGAPLGVATAQTSPDIPTGGSKTPGGGALRPVVGEPQDAARTSLPSFSRLEAITTPWLATLVIGRGRVVQYFVSNRLRVLR